VLRVIIPDSHGAYIDKAAERAFLADLKWLDPGEIVMLGDHVDVSGIFSGHPRNYVSELKYSYREDINAANRFLDAIQKNAPKATIHYLAGNHEMHAERWVARTFSSAEDAEDMRDGIDPEARLQLKRRGIRYYRSDKQYMGLSIPGTIKLGRCYFAHGFRAGKHATSAHLDDFGAPIVHGHTHRSQSVIRRTAASGEIGAWCPGTLAQLQPLYLHTGVSSWTHGYGVQFVSQSGRFLHINVPIVSGQSMLRPLTETMGRRKAA